VRPRNRGSIPDRDKRFFLSRKRPDVLRVPMNLRMIRDIRPLPRMPSWLVNTQVYCTLFTGLYSSSSETSCFMQ
jgi:hypothetical protein